ncbi:NADH-quinone oxidoreductase subunit B [Austwickia chelonae]|uniref:NADH-quinone oxidoreductase subunit B n=1 Tax=Austwickia chelonae TaxID=100225 RepID=UPI0002DB38FF|nr:hypothetical protein [Austwickia chelonae]
MCLFPLRPGLRVHGLDAGLACCAVEVTSAGAGCAGAGPDDPGSSDCGPTDVLVVAGTVTDAMAPLIKAQYEELSAEAGSGLRVISFGSCANTGGPYWDSYAVTKGVDQIVPVDAYVPGCPPRPEALLDAMGELT